MPPRHTFDWFGGIHGPGLDENIGFLPGLAQPLIDVRDSPLSLARLSARSGPYPPQRVAPVLVLLVPWLGCPSADRLRYTPRFSADGVRRDPKVAGRAVSAGS